MRKSILLSALTSLSVLTSLSAQRPANIGGNRLSFLDGAPDPYYVGNGFAKLTTPQWVGEPGVEAAVLLSVDDMRETGRWERFLRPVIERLKAIDGRAPVSIFTCSIDPEHPHLQTWLKEGLSIEVHTTRHPCPLLAGGNIVAAKDTVDECTDLLWRIPNMIPVCFRMPCCDSQNSTSPRFFAEIFNKRTPDGHFLQSDSSVFTLFTEGDRFRKYLPITRGFVNFTENYPFPYVIGGRCWEFPAAIPSDWEANNRFGGGKRDTVLGDLKAGIDFAAKRQGLFTYVFHTNNWGGIGSAEIVELIDRTIATHGMKVKFLNAREITERITKNMLAGHPLRAPDGGENGVRVLDLNADGFMDVVIGNAAGDRITRVWDPKGNIWTEGPKLPFQIDGSTRFGVISKSGHAAATAKDGPNRTLWEFTGQHWLGYDVSPPVEDGIFRDIDGDGICEWAGKNVFGRRADGFWVKLFPAPVDLTAPGSRLIDLDGDGDLDVLFSDHERFSVHLFESMKAGWSKEGKSGVRGERDADDEIPMIVREDGTDNGSWVFQDRLIFQNEDSVTARSQIVSRKFAELRQPFASVLTSEPLDPEESLKVMHTLPGLEVQLAAAEPEVMDPIDLAWGADGKLWVVEMADYPLGIDGKGKPGGRVRWLEDRDGDGRYETSTVFLDGLPTPTGVMPWRNGVLVLAAPDLIYAEDRDGDGAADHREILFSGFGQGNQQHRVNGLRWGLDNWVYIANGDSGGVVTSKKTGQKLDIRGRDLRILPDTGEMQPQSGQTQFGRNRDDWGNWFGCNNSTLMWHYAITDHYIGRNPHVAAPPSRVNLVRISGRLPLFPVSAPLERFNDFNTLNYITSACGSNFYRAVQLGEKLYGNAFVCEPVHNLVVRLEVAAEGTTFSGRRPADHPKSEFLASEDHWFRPTSIRTGPDGALWVTDFYRLVIEHPEWIPEDWERKLDLRSGHDRGRIYRVVANGADPEPPLRMAELPSLDLVARLESDNGTTRDLAQQLLVWRSSEKKWDARVAPALEKMAIRGAKPLSRMQALCTLDGIGKLAKEVAHAACADAHPGVRRHAIRLSERFESPPPRLPKLISDPDPQVRLQLAYSLGAWEGGEAAEALANLLVNHSGGDRYIIAAAISSAPPHLEKLLPAVLANREIDAGVREQLFKTVSAVGDKGALVEWALKSDSASPIDPKRLSDLSNTLEAIGEDPGDGIGLYLEAARKLAKDPEASAGDYRAALGILRYSAEENDGNLLAKFLGANHPPEVQRAAATAIAEGKHPKAVELLAEQFATVGPQLRTSIALRLSATERGSAAILDRIGKSPALAATLTGTIRERLLGHENEGIRRKAEQLFPQPKARAAVIKRYRDELAAGGLPDPDPTAGIEVFKKNCVACHMLDGIGKANVGPDLQALTGKSRETMLVAILDPNHAVEDKFGTYVVRRINGDSLAGMIANESGASIDLLLADGSPRSIPRNEIASVKALGRSLMPEGLEAAISIEEMGDLIAWIAKPRVPLRKFPNNTPKLIAERDGKFVLGAKHASIYGTEIVLEEKYENLGYWGKKDDFARWEVDCRKPGKFRVVVDYAVPPDQAGKSIRIQVAGARVDAKIPSTGNWDTYKRMETGELELMAGVQTIEARSAGPVNGYLLDLRGLELVRIPGK